MVLGVWLPILTIGLLHYGIDPEHGWAHNVLRRLYHLPIIFAAFGLGLRGGLLSAAVVSLTYLPHAFLHIGHLAHIDPAGPVEKALEIVLYNVVGAVAGYLADAERRRRAELRKALDEQRTLQRQLVRAGRLGALGEVVAGIAHEIKNPLHALSGTAEIVDPLIDAEAPQRRMWDIHLAELGRLERVADRFLTFASPKPLETQELDLREVAERLTELVGTDARKKGIEVVSKLPSAPVLVQGDRDQLAQVALNIALNGIRAIGTEGGTVQVCVEACRDFHGVSMQCLRIENDGPPIPSDDLEHLFDPFHTTDDEGTGLGLSISQRIVEQHQGYLEAANAGIGVAFTVLLPRAGEAG
ncbi:MAG: sensor histidine kinase [Deltaproteobacteria bacterium]|nr:sensor histidine kinase [Deltaproteobacteria bacterium]